MATKDMVINFYGPNLKEVLSKLIVRPAVYVHVGDAPDMSQWAYKYSSLDSIFRSFGGQKGDTLGRVAVMGFSKGCGGIYGILDRHKQIDPRIDCILGIDGVAGGWDPQKRQVTSIRSSVATFVEHCARVSETSPVADASGKFGRIPSPVSVITASSIGAGVGVFQEGKTFAPTLDVSKVLQGKAIAAANALGGPPVASAGFGGFGGFQTYTMPGTAQAARVLALKKVTYPGPGYPLGSELAGMKVSEAGILVRNNTNIPANKRKTYAYPSLLYGAYPPVVVNNAYFFGWQNQDKAGGGNADHIFQGTPVAVAMANEFIVCRWNPACTDSKGETKRVYSFAELYSAASCEPGSGIDPSTRVPIPIPPESTEPMPVPTICINQEGQPIALGPDLLCPGEYTTGGGGTVPSGSGPATQASGGLSAGEAALTLLGVGGLGYAITRWWQKRKSGR